MATNIDLFIDITSGYLRPLGTATLGNLPTLTKSDIYNLRLRLQEQNDLGEFVDIDTSGFSAKAGIGFLDSYPTAGNFLLTAAGPVTSSNIPYNATTTQFLNAVSGIVGNVTVATYGPSGSSWLVTAATANTALSFGGVASTLFPTSSVLVSTRRNYATAVCAQQIVQLKRNPAVYADSFTTAPTAGQATFTKIQDGGATANESYSLLLGPDVIGGGVVFGFGGTNTSTAVPALASNSTFLQALSAVTGIGSGNISVESGNAEGERIITFVRNLGQTNVSTDLTADLAGLVFANYLQATLTMGTAELEELFFEEGTETITPKLEIEITSDGTRKTAVQNDVTIQGEIISTGSIVPADFASYYTKAEVDSAFVEDSTSNVDATNRRLKNSGGTTIVDYGLASFGSGGMVNLNGSTVTIGSSPIYAGSTVTVAGAVSFGGGMTVSGSIGFFGATAITKPNGANAISNVVSLGLIASSSTYGVFPGSNKTLTTTASIYFGQVNSNSTNSVSVVVTGCNLLDIVLLGLPASMDNGLTFVGHVTTANGVEIDCVNATNGNITPATASYRITVIGY